MVERFKEVAMGRTRAELAARLREGFEANNFAPVLEVIAELEAPEAAPVPEPNEWDVPPADMVEEHDDEEPDGVSEYPAWGDDDAPSGHPDRAGEDGEESPGLHHRTRS